MCTLNLKRSLNYDIPNISAASLRSVSLSDDTGPSSPSFTDQDFLPGQVVSELTMEKGIARFFWMDAKLYHAD